MLVALPRRQMLAGRGPLLPSPALVSRSPFVPVLFLFLLILGLGFVSSPSWCPDRPSADQEDIDAIMEDVAKDATAEAEKVAAEESAKGATEDAGKGPAGEAGKGPAGGPARPPPRRRWSMTSLPPLLPPAPASI